MFPGCDFFVDLIEKFDVEVCYSSSVIGLSVTTCQLAGEILSLEPETGMIANTTTNVPFFSYSPLVVKGDYNLCTYLLTYLLCGAESFLRS